MTISDLAASLPHDLPGLGGFAMLAWILYRQAGTRKLAGEVHEQVQNSHTTNFRQDIDDFRAEVAESFKGLREDITGLRGEVRDERKDRADADRDINDRLRELEQGGQ